MAIFGKSDVNGLGSDAKYLMKKKEEDDCRYYSAMLRESLVMIGRL